jgi:hypothetical protein
MYLKLLHVNIVTSDTFPLKLPNVKTKEVVHFSHVPRFQGISLALATYFLSNHQIRDEKSRCILHLV